MNDSRLDRDALARVLLISAALALLVALVFIIWPKSSSTVSAQAKDKQVATMKAEVKRNDADSRVFEAAIAQRTWNKSAQQIGPVALDSVNRLARAHGLKLTTFRPQKAIDLDGLQQLPYLLAVEGPFPDLIVFVKELEKPETKLALSMLQLSSADGISDRVTATIGVAAFTLSTPQGGNSGKS